MVCDFCSAANPRFFYRSVEFQRDVSALLPELKRNLNVDQLIINFDEIWAACSICAEMIDAGARERLLGRTVATSPVVLATQEEREKFREFTRVLHNSFWAHHTPREEMGGRGANPDNGGRGTHEVTNG